MVRCFRDRYDYFRGLIAGIVSIALLVGIFFFIDGVLRVFLAFKIKRAKNWSWALFHGIASIILGILIWSEWPFNAPWVLGLLVGTALLINGVITALFPVVARENLPRI